MTDTPTDTQPETDERDPHADLALIRSMMSEGRNRIAVDGQHVTLWGILLTLAFASLYGAIIMGFKNPTLVIWGPIIALGWGLSFWIGSKGRGQSADRDNPVLRGYASVWMGVGISALIGFLVSLTGSRGFSGHIMMILTSGLFGTAFFTIAHLMRLRWLYLVAAAWWCMLALFGYIGRFTLDMLAFMPFVTFFLIVVPGLALMRGSKRLQASD